MACALVLFIGLGTRWLLGAEADVATSPHPDEERSAVKPLRLRAHPMLVAVGMIAFCSMFAEGAVDNWSGVFLHQVRHASLAVAPLGTALCGTGMALGRFLGDGVITRHGRLRTLVGASLLASGGMALALLGGTVVTGVAGYGILGLGVATIVPIAFTIAGSTPSLPPAWSLSRVTAMSYVGQATSPALIGLVAQGIGLSWSLAMPTVLLLAILPLTRYAVS